jgi:hypothetical protein
MSRNRFLLLFGGCLLAASAAWADDVGYVDCSNHPDDIQVFAKPRRTPDVLASVPCGARFTILVYGFVFSRIQTGDGKVGYVYSNLIAVDRTATAAQQNGSVRMASEKSIVPSSAPPAVKPTVVAQPQSASAPSAATQVPAQPQPAAAAPVAVQSPTITPPAVAPPVFTAPVAASPASISNAPESAATPAQPQPSPVQPAAASAQSQLSPAPPTTAPAPSFPAPVSSAPEMTASVVAQPDRNAAAQPEPAAAPAEPPAPAPAVRPANDRTSWEKPNPGLRRRAPLLEFYGGYAFARIAGTAGTSSNLNGAMGSFGWNVTPWLQILGDSSYNVVTVSGTKNVLYGNHFGPRYFHRSRNRWGLTPFVEALVGGSRADTTVSGTGGYKYSDNCLSYKAGGGVDIHPSRHIDVRLFDVDYYRTAFGANLHQNNYWASAGIVVRLFGGGSE